MRRSNVLSLPLPLVFPGISVSQMYSVGMVAEESAAIIDRVTFTRRDVSTIGISLGAVYKDDGTDNTCH
jgi:hypothetical protein